MIYQHRLVIAREGRLVRRNAVFQRETLAALEAQSLVLIGATTNAGSHRSIELRRFPDLKSWQLWREALFVVGTPTDAMVVEILIGVT